MINQDQHSSEVMVKKLDWDHIHICSNNGAQHLERLTWNLMKELSLMLTLNSQLERWNMIMPLIKQTELAQLQVVSKLMLNYLMKLHGRLRITLIQTSSGLNIEIDIIRINHSINQLSEINTEDWIEKNSCMIIMIASH